ncbi:MAG: hypothetical protein AAFO94_06115 [Bacteroidota bacterium]
MYKTFVGIFILILMMAHTSSAQFGSAPGGHPSWIKWRQIDTDTVRLIYPEGLEPAAQRAVGMIHYMYANNRSSIGPHGGKFNILFRNQTVVPNGFVGSNPYRSEFYATPVLSNFAGPVDWMDLLTIHEYRHVMQTHNADVGIAKLVHWLSGEATWAGMTFLAIPNWFDEGDATIMETALTPSGRGRVPKFLAGYRALALDSIRYSYEKLRNGSLKHFLPNHYRTGYLMSSYVRNNFDNELWSEIYSDAVRYRGIFYPFSRSLKKRTGMNTVQLYHQTLDEADARWRGEATDNNLRKSRVSQQLSRPHRKNTPTFYRFPQPINEDTYIVAMRSFKQRNALYQIQFPENNKDAKAYGKETRLVQMGITFDENFSYKNGTAVWSELAFHPRWDYLNYYVIKSFNITTKEKKSLTSQSKYVGPDISNDGKRIVAVDVTDQRKYQLHILKAFDGTLMEKINTPEDIFWAYPKWTTDDQHLIVVATKEQQNALVKVDPASGEITELVPYTSNFIEHPYVTADYVFFTFGYNGTDNIYAVPIAGGPVRQVTNAEVRAATAGLSLDGRYLLYFLVG